MAIKMVTFKNMSQKQTDKL